jgi:ADP-ribosylglycohydrolase
MFDTCTPSTQKINLETYRDKVLGCWTGKNIGGTIGAPFEGKKEVNKVTFYTQDLGGKPEPNDDLDLQLIWLLAAEENGIYHLNERVLGEYWLSHITGPWNEYGVCKSNIRNGLYPPLSGSCNNDKWKYSNGAWIRSEIWACIFPGSPDEAAMYAYYDSCCDHCGEGIYAEIFTATMESAAFILSDIRELIQIGLSRIPSDCRIAQSVKLACEHYDKGSDFLLAREALVKDSEDLGWFQAPANIGYVIVGLLYGEGDFGKSVCIATNCGDDTDCTAGTVGALLGIILGRSGIPAEWIEPIGESIQTCSIDTYERNNLCTLPKTLDALTDRVINIAVSAQRENPTLPQISGKVANITRDFLAKLKCSDAVEKRIWSKSPCELTFELPYGKISFDYDNGVEVVPGEEKKLTINMSNVRFIEKVVSVKLLLPEGWQALPALEFVFTVKHSHIASVEMTLIPGEFSGAYYYLPVEVRLCDRLNPIVVHLPLQRKGSVQHNLSLIAQEYRDSANRCKSRIP